MIGGNCEKIVLVLVISAMLAGCGNNELTFTDVSLVRKGNVKGFIENVEVWDDGKKTYFQVIGG